MMLEDVIVNDWLLQFARGFTQSVNSNIAMASLTV